MSFQLGSALLDACVLATLESGDTYGYVLTQSVRTIVDVSESTLYPVLRRLLKDGLLTAYDSQYGGRNRRYYRITDSGRRMLMQYKNDWNNYKRSIDAILFGSNDKTGVM
ncbi:MAG: PadR family transcriptional regulator [Lachnospira sp.]